eukprot:3999562-Pyramimonas_sp.AAC.1
MVLREEALVMATALTRPLTIFSWLKMGSCSGCMGSSCACGSQGISRATPPVPAWASPSSAETN